MLQVGTVRVDRRVSTVTAREVPVFVGLRSRNFSHVTERKDRKVCDARAEGCHVI
jgi:hypothetical protein